MGHGRLGRRGASGAVELLERAADMVADPILAGHTTVPRLGVVLYNEPRFAQSVRVRNYMDQGSGSKLSSRRKPGPQVD